jgi:hypothetical protein
VIEPLATVPYNCRRIALTMLAALSSLIMLVYPPAVAASSVQCSDRASYVLFAPGSRSSTMSGSTDDLSRARALRVGREGLLYVRSGGSAYVIRDAATLRQARLIFGPQEALGEQQAKLGSRQAALGSAASNVGCHRAQFT